jgi:hypothetical protein
MGQRFRSQLTDSTKVNGAPPVDRAHDARSNEPSDPRELLVEGPDGRLPEPGPRLGFGDKRALTLPSLHEFALLQTTEGLTDRRPGPSELSRDLGLGRKSRPVFSASARDLGFERFSQLEVVRQLTDGRSASTAAASGFEAPQP